MKSESYSNCTFSIKRNKTSKAVTVLSDTCPEIDYWQSGASSSCSKMCDLRHVKAWTKSLSIQFFLHLMVLQVSGKTAWQENSFISPQEVEGVTDSKGKVYYYCDLDHTNDHDTEPKKLAEDAESYHGNYFVEDGVSRYDKPSASYATQFFKHNKPWPMPPFGYKDPGYNVVTGLEGFLVPNTYFGLLPWGIEGVAFILVAILIVLWILIMIFSIVGWLLGYGDFVAKKDMRSFASDFGYRDQSRQFHELDDFHKLFLRAIDRFSES